TPEGGVPNFDFPVGQGPSLAGAAVTDGAGGQAGRPGGGSAAGDAAVAGEFLTVVLPGVVGGGVRCAWVERVGEV
ncbi:hypothetical protein BMH30_10300, partial [Leucobacter sp. OLES1]